MRARVAEAIARAELDAVRGANRDTDAIVAAVSSQLQSQLASILSRAGMLPGCFSRNTSKGMEVDFRIMVWKLWNL